MTGSSVPWRINWTSEAARSLNRIPPRVLGAVMEFVATRLAENPQRATHALGAPFEGKNSGNVGRYRVMVRIDEATHTVHIVRVEYRGTVYQPR